MLNSVILPVLMILVFSTLASLASSLIHHAEAKSKDIVTLKQGQTLRLEFEKDHPIPIKAVSLVVRSIDNSDPFTSSDVPLTVEVFEKNKLIGSESFTSELGGNNKRIHVDVNNDPMIKGNFKIAIRFDVPEFSKDDNRLTVNIDSIKFNDGKIHMHQHGDIKIILAT